MFKKIFSKQSLTFVLTFIFCLAMCSFAFAEGGSTFDLTSTVTSSVESIATQLMSVLGVVVTGIVGFFGAKIAINKAFGFIKTMIGKA